MTSSFKPMLAGKFREDKLRFPLIVQPKLDGIRAAVVNGKLVSRSLKPIPNAHVRRCLERPEFEGFDGELIVGDPRAEDAFRTTTSGVMSPDGTPEFVYYVFDRWNSDLGYRERYTSIGNVAAWTAAYIFVLPWAEVFDRAGLDNCEAKWVKEGYEGVILRDPNGRYKFGRGSATKFDLIKLKRFVDFEAEVVGYEEEQHNTNEAKTNELGRTERSTAKAGMVGKGTLGKLICRRADGVEFGCGTGFSAPERASLWQERDSLIGRTAKVKCFPVGEKDKPRFPTFLGFRDAADIS